MQEVLIPSEPKAQKSVPELRDAPVVSFFRAYPYAIPAMRADKSALGTLPARAHQYCEAVTTASGFGWYVFPAADVQLWFDGVDTFIANGDTWEKLLVTNLPDSDTWWKQYCPSELADRAPPFVSTLGVPGFVQIWTGLLVESAKDWSILCRPIANYPKSNNHFCFEGIVETDDYSPAPLFINIKLQNTGDSIVFPADEPLFQVQPIHRSCYSPRQLSNYENREVGGDEGLKGLSDAQWAGYTKTVKSLDPLAGEHELGQYARETRQREKRERRESFSSD